MNDDKSGWINKILLVLIIFLFLSIAGYKVTKISVSIPDILQVEMEKITPTPTEYFTFEMYEPATPTFTFEVYDPPTDEIILLNTPEDYPSATEAVYFYFSQVSTGNYETGWDLLSDTFRTINNPTGFDPYREYWDSVDEVYVTNATLLFDDSDSATVLTDLEYHYLDGRVIPVIGMKINLKFEPNRQVWLIQSIE